MSFQAQIDQRRRSLASRGIRPGLETVTRVLESLGSPHRRFPAVLVGGTNGKGSTAALLTSMATTAGYRVGLFTSPYLQRFEEQIQVAGLDIPGPRLLDIWDRVVDQAERLHPGAITAFEVLTICAYVHFAEQEVELTICEVGMGGRLDSSNVLSPVISIVTSLGMDHASFLGPSLASIAAHKGGIFRPGRPALISWTEPSTGEKLLLDEARRVGADAKHLRREVQQLDALPRPDGSQDVQLRTPEESYHLHLPLAGPHQLYNLAAAVRGAEELRRLGWQRLDAGAIAEGTAACRWPGRLETLEVRGTNVLLDTAHNAQGAAALADYLNQLGISYDLLFGAFADKDGTSMLEHLGDARRLWLTAPLSDRAWDPHAFEPSAVLSPSCRVEEPLDFPEALRRALDEASRWLVITGSLRLVGDARNYLFQHFPELCLNHALA